MKDLFSVIDFDVLYVSLLNGIMLGTFSLLTHQRDISSLFLKGEGSSRSDSNKAQVAGMKLIQHLPQWRWYCFVEFIFCDACWVTPLFLRSFCLILLELIVSWSLVLEINIQTKKRYAVPLYHTPSQSKDESDQFLLNFEQRISDRMSQNPHFILVMGQLTFGRFLGAKMT